MWCFANNHWRLGLAWAGLVVTLPTCADAGAWTLPEDKTLAIVTTSYQIAPAGSLISGVRTKEDLATQVFLETGLFEDLTLGFTAYSEFSSLTGETDTRLGLHARHRVWQGWNGSVASLQIGVELPANDWLGQIQQPDSVVEIDARALFGMSWQLDWANSFVSTELGYRVRRSGQADEVLFDGTLGLEPWDGVLGLFTVSSTVPLENTGRASFMVTPSLAFTLWPQVGTNDKKPNLKAPPQTLQIGIGYDVLNPGDGIRLSGGIWTWF